MRKVSRTLLIPAIFLGGCTALIGDPANQASEFDGPANPTNPRRPTDPNDPNDPSDPVDPCVGAPADDRTPALRRLSHFEHNNTVRDLFPNLSFEPRSFAEDIRAHGFENNAEVLAPSPLLIEQYQHEAVELTELAVERFLAGETLAGVPRCSRNSRAESITCGNNIITAFGRRAFRRPLSSEELTEFSEFFSEQLTLSNFNVSLQLVLQFILQSPEAIYRELEGGQYSLASRLAYFLTGSGPDQLLLAAAESGKLSTRVEIEAETRRLLSSEKARANKIDFHRQWLNWGRLDQLNKDSDAHPTFNDSLRASMREESQRFVASAKTMEELFLSREIEVNASLAALYGVSAPSQGWETRTLPATERAGIFTQAGFLASHAHAVEPSPVLRGVFVLERMLCTTVPPPEADVDTTPPRRDPEAGPTTNRQRYIAHLNEPKCANCHAQIDGIGFAFENYDSIGAFRTIDNTLPVDASGHLRGTDSDRPFNGAVELAEILAESKQVERCVTTQWFRYALGRNAAAEDACALHTAENEFAGAGQSFEQLMISIAASAPFSAGR
jgi:hypothetical protein